MTLPDLLSTLTESLRARLLVHGYHLTPEELKDVVAHLAQPSIMFCDESRIPLDDASFDALSAEIANPSKPTDALVALWSPAQSEVGL